MTPSRIVSGVLRKLGQAIVPEHRRLRWDSWVHTTFEAAEPELLHVSRMLPANQGVAIDVGANVGYWALALSKFCQHVHAFEINPGVARWLKASRLQNVSIHDVGLSSSSGSATLYVPVRDDIGPLYGWASLMPGNCPGVERHLEVPVNIVTLDSFALLDVGFIKIDVEGHELEVLRGGEQTLRRERPNLLIEVKEQNLEAVRSYLESLDYAEESAPGVLAAGAGGENHFFMAHR